MNGRIEPLGFTSMPSGESNQYVAHLRVPTTGIEQRMVPAGLVTMDAGEVGYLRVRSW
jgi:hypothetical protein